MSRNGVSGRVVGGGSSFVMCPTKRLMSQPLSPIQSTQQPLHEADLTKASRRRFSALFNRSLSPMAGDYRAALAYSALASACARRCHSDDIHIPRPILRVLCSYSAVLSSAAAMETSRYDETQQPTALLREPGPKPQRAMKARDHSIDWLLSNHRCYADVTWRRALLILWSRNMRSSG